MGSGAQPGAARHGTESEDGNGARISRCNDDQEAMMMPWLRHWEFCRKRDCRDRDRVASPSDRLSARQWLQQFATDTHKMLAMRTLLYQASVAWPLSATSDEEVIDQTAELLISGRLHVHAQRNVSVDASAPSEPPRFVPFPLSDRQPRPQTGASNAPASDPPTFASDIDGSAQANALAAAAAGGQPFCPQ